MCNFLIDFYSLNRIKQQSIYDSWVLDLSQLITSDATNILMDGLRVFLVENAVKKGSLSSSQNSIRSTLTGYHYSTKI